MQASLAEDLNAKNITAADFSVWVSRVGGVDADPAHLEDFARHYGSVVGPWAMGGCTASLRGARHYRSCCAAPCPRFTRKRDSPSCLQVMAFHVLSVGPVLAICNKIQEDDLVLKELELLSSGAPPESGSCCCCCCGPLGSWLYRRWICGLRAPRSALEARKAASQQRRNLLLAKEGQPLEPTGNAIVVFQVGSGCCLLQDC